MIWFPGPGRVATLGSLQRIPTREPNLDPRSETMCLLEEVVSIRFSSKLLMKWPTECD